MRKMKDSGIEWIGDIPKVWKLKRLKALLVERKEKNDPVQTHFILSLGANYGVIPYSQKEGGGNKAKEDVSSYRLAYPGDIVMNSMNIISGSVGLSKYFGCVSPVYYMFYPRNRNSKTEYYHYLFQTKVFQHSLLGLGNGILMKESGNGTFNTVRMRIPVEKLNALMLPFPPLNEQERIVVFLDSECAAIDTILEKTRASIDEYKKLKQAVITQAVTKGIRGDRPMKDSGIDYIGNIPNDWDVCRLRNIGYVQNGISKSGEFFGSGYPFISYSDVYKNIELPSNITGRIESTKDERMRYSVQIGDIFFTRTSETIEEVGFSSVCMKTVPDATFAGFLIRVRPFNQKLDVGFSKYYFRSSHHRTYIVKEMNLVTRASLGQNLLKSMPVLVPPKGEQQEIANYLDAKCAEIDNLTSKKEQYITEIENYKKSLIYEYVTGKKEVI